MKLDAPSDHENLPELPSELEAGLGLPFDGLFGDSVAARVLQEVVADPYKVYRTKELAHWTNSSPPSVRKALRTLVELGVLREDVSRPRQPLYSAKLESKRLFALTTLAFAAMDDRGGTHIMDDALRAYCQDDRKSPLVAVLFFNVTNSPPTSIRYEVQESQEALEGVAPERVGSVFEARVVPNEN